MQIVHEQEQLNKGGVRYMIRGPTIDWGTITLNPGETKSAHYHEKLAETFYTIEGTITFVLKDEEIDIPKGTAIRLNPNEPHGLKNKTNQVAKLIFIKEQYIPDDKKEWNQSS
ncbi:MAG: cupin domain-containing protein [Candidatus Lokiarchaeota archaeon]|nr:cupin domain-containing protein [Candidatus Harpocratesius repetitus]